MREAGREVAAAGGPATRGAGREAAEGPATMMP